MKAQSYGKYDVFDTETATTWEEAEALALKARGKSPSPHAKAAPAQRSAAAPEAVRKLLESREPELSEERQLLNRALILLIHLRERVFQANPEVEGWVNEILSDAKGK